MKHYEILHGRGLSTFIPPVIAGPWDLGDFKKPNILLGPPKTIITK